MSVYQADTSGTSSFDDVLDNSDLLYTSIDGYTVLYNPKYIKCTSAQGQTDLSDVPLSWIDKDKGRCYVLNSETTKVTEATEACLTFNITDVVSSVILHNMPITDYILNINGSNVCTSKNNIFNLTEPRPNSMLEIHQSIQNKVGCLDFGKLDIVRMCVPNTIKLPSKFYYTVNRPDNGRRTYINYPTSTKLSWWSRLVALILPINDELVLQIDGKIILHVKSLPTRKWSQSGYHITVRFSDEFLNTKTDTSNCYTDVAGTITLIMYKEYEYPSFRMRN